MPNPPILIQNGRVVRGRRKTTVTDVLIQDGIISCIQRGVTAPTGCQVIDAAGKLVLPGLIDVHAHLREPGYEYKETIATGTAAAAAGGVTTVCCMPNTNPVNDNQAVTEFILDTARTEGAVRVLPIGAMTEKSQGETMSPIGELIAAGCIALSDDGHPVSSSLMMRRVMEYAKAFGVPVIDHCEDRDLAGRGVMNEGLVSTELGLVGIPAVAEEVHVARDIALAEMTGCRLHIAHISTAGSIRMVREAKLRGVPVTAEACPHHFTLTDDAVRDFNSHAKVNPPLRTWSDVQAVRAGLQDGTIDVIATDHAPHAREETEQEFDKVPFGISGLETALSLTLALVHEGVLDLETAVLKLSSEPARVFGITGGTLCEGKPADVIVVDPEEQWVVDPATFRSKGHNTPFAGRKLKGRVVMTLVEGHIAFSRNGTPCR